MADQVEEQDGPSEDRFRGAPRPKSLEEQIYDKSGKLTYEGARKALAAGHSVLHGTTIISHVSHLPSEADFAAGDQARVAAARKNLLDQQAQIAAELAKLGNEKPDALVGHKEDPALTAPLGGIGQGDTAGAARFGVTPQDEEGPKDAKGGASDEEAAKAQVQNEQAAGKGKK